MYKLVSNDLRSFCHTQLNSNWRVQYSLAEFVYPNIENTKLFVFDTLQSANLFARYEIARYSDRLFKCEVINPARLTRSIPMPEYADYFWFKKRDGDKVVIGTYLVDAVKLVEELNYSGREGFYESK